MESSVTGKRVLDYGSQLSATEEGEEKMEMDKMDPARIHYGSVEQSRSNPFESSQKVPSYLSKASFRPS